MAVMLALRTAIALQTTMVLRRAEVVRSYCSWVLRIELHCFAAPEWDSERVSSFTSLPCDAYGKSRDSRTTQHVPQLHYLRIRCDIALCASTGQNQYSNTCWSQLSNIAPL